MNFWRNSVVSVTAVFIMSVTLFVIGSLIFLGVILDSSLQYIKSKVDINIYFTLDAPEDEIFAMKDSLEGLPEVEEVTYTSREDALDAFNSKHQNDYLIIQGLNELGDNPLRATLSIRAKETSQYAGIVEFIEQVKQSDALSNDGASIIDKENYYENKIVIDRMTHIIGGAEKLGFALTIFLAIISIIITFNTIRLAIYTAREEISVMRLVGADNKYVRGPFIVEGIIYGLFSATITMAVFYPITYWLGDAAEDFFSGVNLYAYYLDHFVDIFLILIVSGILLGAVSSFLAVRKYLKT